MAPKNVQHTEYLSALWSTLLRKPAIVLLPLAAGGLIGLLIGVFGPRQWGASQTFVVREELIGRIVGPGRFESLDRMKTAQETISELARRPGVVRKALQAIGPDSIFSGKDWPDEETVEGVGQSISFYAAGGGDFGKTEVLTMQVKASSRERGRQFVAALFDELQQEVRQFREERARSMVEETRQAQEIASQRYDGAMQRLSEMEKEVGPDLSDLRSLSEPMGGSGELRKQSALIENEIRGISARLAVNEELDRHLQGIRGDSSRLLVTPRELLDSQPVLARLKERLVDARFVLATASGNYTAKHPRVQAATKTVADVEAQIFLELEAAIAGLASQRTILEKEMAGLNGKIGEIDARLGSLAAKRASYSQLVDETGQAKEALGLANQEMIQAEGIFRAASTVNLVTPVDEPLVTTQPLGPGRKALLMGGLLAGAFVGVGLLMIATPVAGYGFSPPDSRQPATPPTPTKPEIQEEASVRDRQPVAAVTADSVGEPEPEPLPETSEETAEEEELPEPVVAVAEPPPPAAWKRLPVTVVPLPKSEPVPDESANASHAVVNEESPPVQTAVESEPEIVQERQAAPIPLPKPDPAMMPTIHDVFHASPVAFGPDTYFDSRIAPEIAKAILADLVAQEPGSVPGTGKTFVIPFIGKGPFGNPGAESQTS